MAHTVSNSFVAFGNANLEEQVGLELERACAELDMGLTRTMRDPDNDDPCRFISAWAPDFDLQDHLVRRLAIIDPTVRLANIYREEFLQAVGTRVAWVSSSGIESTTVNYDLRHLAVDGDPFDDDFADEVGHSEVLIEAREWSSCELALSQSNPR